jgi:hypothetical protein
MGLAWVLVLFLTPLSLGALDIHIAPILFFDETDEYSRDQYRVEADLFSELIEVEAGIDLNFFLPGWGGVNPPESLMDAVTLARNERAGYLLYGYVNKRAYTLQAEIRLLDYGSRQIRRTFYAMDDTASYGRLIADVAGKIRHYIAEEFHLDIVEGEPAFTSLEIPVGVGYWVPMSSGWAKLVVGTVTAGTGFLVIPTDKLFILWGQSFYISFGLEAAYRYGASNPDSYDVNYHGMMIALPVKLHMKLKDRHHVYLGAAFNYYADIWNTALKYEAVKMRTYSNVGYTVRFGYRFNLGKRLLFYWDNGFQFTHYEQPLCTYSPGLGVEIKIYFREYLKRW